MNCLAVTGASGFIGRRFCQIAISKGRQVVAIGHVTAPEIPGAVCFNWNDGIKNCSGEDYRCIHLAGISNIHDFEGQAQENGSIQVQMLEQVLNTFSNVILTSSAAVYGSGYSQAFDEQSSVRPQSAYAAMKLKLEQICLEHSGCVARLANVYGPGMSRKSVFAALAEGLFGKQECVEVRSTKDVRDYIYVDDAVEALLRFSDLGASGMLINIGSGEGLSVQQLFELTSKTLKIRKSLRETKSGDATYLVLNSAKAERMLSWKPKTPLSDGIRITMEALKA